MISLLLAVLVSVAAQTPTPAKPDSSAEAAYIVGVSDVLGIKVFEEPELSRAYNVDTDGTVTFPFLGRVPVSGKTVREIEALLTKGLADGYVRRPQVSVEVTSYRSRNIYVLGEVKNSGKYSIEGQVTLLEVIAKAGSLTANAGNTIIVQRNKDGAGSASPAPALPGNDRTTEVLRVNVEDLREGKLNANIPLQDGDTIVVPPAERFYVSGYVRTPGSFVLQPKMTVQQAIAVAGGLTERGSNRGIKIRRNVNGKEIEIDARLTDVVQPNDTILIRQRLI